MINNHYTNTKLISIKGELNISVHKKKQQIVQLIRVLGLLLSKHLIINRNIVIQWLFFEIKQIFRTRGDQFHQNSLQIFQIHVRRFRRKPY